MSTPEIEALARYRRLARIQSIDAVFKCIQTNNRRGDAPALVYAASERALLNLDQSQPAIVDEAHRLLTEWIQYVYYTPALCDEWWYEMVNDVHRVLIVAVVLCRISTNRGGAPTALSALPISVIGLYDRMREFVDAPDRAAAVAARHRAMCLRHREFAELYARVPE